MTRLDLCRKPSNEATNPSCTDLDTVDVDAELEIVPTSPLPEPQFLSNPESTPVKYPTLGMLYFWVKGRIRSCGFLRIFTYTDDRFLG